jgi:hypothetical protein
VVAYFEEHVCALLIGRVAYEPRQLPIARLEDGTMWNW